MKFFAKFPTDAGQYAGTHFFATLKSRTAFLHRAQRRGIDTSNAVLGVGKF